MTDRTDRTDEDALEALIDRALRDLPPRRAPLELERQVFARIQRRVALPWWRRGFREWPVAARSAWVLVCGTLLVLTLRDGPDNHALADAVNNAGAVLLSWANPLVAVMASVRGATTLIGRVIPAHWLHVGFAAGALLYVLLFGLGAAAYRTLYLQPSNGRY